MWNRAVFPILKARDLEQGYRAQRIAPNLYVRIGKSRVEAEALNEALKQRSGEVNALEME